MGGLDYVNKLVQVSMDGPNVNWKLHELLEETRDGESNCSAPTLLQLGSCGLHVLHGAYGTGQKATDWELGKLLKHCYSIFNKSPARRSDYLLENGFHETHAGKNTGYLFPLKFCGFRWLENSACITTLLEIIPYIKIYFTWLEDNKKMPKDDNRFLNIKQKINLCTTEPMLKFSLCIMNELDPVLSIFQGEKPLSVFLYETFKAVFLSVLERIVRSEMLKYKLNQLFKIDYTLEKNVLPASSVNVGFAATNSLKQLLKSTRQVSSQKIPSASKEYDGCIHSKDIGAIPLEVSFDFTYISIVSNTNQNCVSRNTY